MFKKGDKVKIIGGRFKGEIGEVIDYDEEFDIYLVNAETHYGDVFGKNLRLVPTEHKPSQEELNYLENDMNMTETAYKQLELKRLLNSLYGDLDTATYCDTDSTQNSLNHYLTDGNLENLFKDKTDMLKPNHYQGKNGDLFDEWYERYPFEVFRIVLLATAERYFRRYHLKDGLDGLNKGIEVMKRLEEYELKEKNND